MKYMILIVTIFVCAYTEASIRPNSLFSEHAVLQQGVILPVWGTGNSGDCVTIEINGQRKQTTVVNDKWLVYLDPMPAGGPFTLIISGSESKVEIKDIYVGEVWVCSGQSNMERQLGPRPPQKLITDWEKERDSAHYPLIREFYVPVLSSDEPIPDVKSEWVICSPETVPNFSCVGYFFARDLYNALKIPVGIIFSAMGGTPAEFWTSRTALEGMPEFKDRLDKYEQSLTSYAMQVAQYKREGRIGKEPLNPAERGHVCGYYNAMIAPLQPYAIKGVNWYQGEGNRHNPEQYKKLLPLLIDDWRKTWTQGDFPFLFVQIAPYKEMPPEIREAQLFVLKNTKNTAMVVTTDCGDENDIHPSHKQPVGYRLSLAARSLAYKEKIEYSGPIYEFMEINNDKAIVNFSHAQNGLVSRNGKLHGFMIAGEDRQFVPAEVKITGNRVILSNPNIKEPVAVRYGWESVPRGNLYNKEGMPASPFRTDHFN